MSDAEGPYTQYESGATFVRRCSNCNRFVKADARVFVNEETGLKKAPNADCSKCGRTEMIFIGFLSLILALSGCAPVRVLFLPSECHPAEAIPDGAGGFVIVPDPCDYNRRAP